MIIRFEETMRGSWHPSGEPERLFCFNLKATGVPWRGTFAVVGALRADGLKTVGPCSGNVSISLHLRGTIAYDLEFRGDDGCLYGLTGAKDFDPFRPVSSLTTLPFTVLGDGGEPIGVGTVRLGLRDLLRFLRSFRFAA